MENLETEKNMSDQKKAINSIKVSGFIALFIGILVLSLILSGVSKDLAILIGVSSMLFILPGIFIILKPLKSKILLILLLIFYVLTLINTLNDKSFISAIIYAISALQTYSSIKNLNKLNTPPEKEEVLQNKDNKVNANEIQQKNIETDKNKAVPLTKKLIWIAALTIPIIVVVGIFLNLPQDLNEVPSTQHGAYSETELINSLIDGNLYQNKDSHYSFILPDGWKKIPENIIDEYRELLSEQLGYQINSYNSAFQPIDQEYFNYPYFFIQETDIKNETFNKILLDLKNQGLMVKLKDEFLEEFKEIFSNIEFGEAIVDEDNYKIFLVFEADTEMGAIKGLGVMNFGKDLIVNLFFYSTSEEYENLLPDFQKITSSFEFEKDYKYKN